MNYEYKKTVISTLLLPVLLLSIAARADVLEVVQSSQGTLELVRRLPKDPTQSAKEVATAKKTVTSVGKTHDFIKNYGLMIASCAPMVIPQQYLQLENGIMVGTIVGAALGAIINDSDRLNGAALGVVVGAATGQAMVIKSPCTSIILRTTHGAILNTESVDTIVSGATCGAIQGAAEMATEKAFAYKRNNQLGPIPATLLGAAVIASIGMPTKVTYPKLIIAGELTYQLQQVVEKTDVEPLSEIKKAFATVAVRTTQHLVATRIREKFTELETKRAQAAQDKKVS